MANAVENSAVVLICMSEKYKDSYNCRSGICLEFSQYFNNCDHTTLFRIIHSKGRILYTTFVILNTILVLKYVIETKSAQKNDIFYTCFHFSIVLCRGFKIFSFLASVAIAVILKIR